MESGQHSPTYMFVITTKTPHNLVVCLLIASTGQWLMTMTMVDTQIS